MTRKDFEAIAAILAEQHSHDSNSHDYLVIYDTANDLADYLATRNPHFDRARFLRACGLL